MALLTTGDFYSVTFYNLNDASWTGLASMPGIPPALGPYIRDGSSCTIYVTDAATGTFVFSGGQATGFDDMVLASFGAAFSKETISTQEGVDFVWGKSGAGSVFMYLEQFGTLSSYSVGEAGDLKTFLP